jgi:hypothetical protein
VTSPAGGKDSVAAAAFACDGTRRGVQDTSKAAFHALACLLHFHPFNEPASDGNLCKPYRL